MRVGTVGSANNFKLPCRAGNPQEGRIKGVRLFLTFTAWVPVQSSAPSCQCTFKRTYQTLGNVKIPAPEASTIPHTGGAKFGPSVRHSGPSRCFSIKHTRYLEKWRTPSRAVPICHARALLSAYLTGLARQVRSGPSTVEQRGDAEQISSVVFGSFQLAEDEQSAETPSMASTNRRGGLAASKASLPVDSVTKTISAGCERMRPTTNPMLIGRLSRCASMPLERCPAQLALSHRKYDASRARHGAR